MKWTTTLAVLSSTLFLNGCWSTTVRSGLPAGETKLEADERWHSGFVGGTQEASGPYDIRRICPEGWSEIKTETSFANGLVDVFTASLYNPQTITITCARTNQVAKAEVPAARAPR